MAAIAVSTTAFQDRLCHRHQQLCQRERRRIPLCRTRSAFRIYAGLQDRGYTDNVKEQTRSRKPAILLEPSFLVSRRSAATSIATAAASILCSAPAIASEGEEQKEDKIATLTTDNSDTRTTDKAPPQDAPVGKEKNIEYSVQDFTMVLPENWKVITKYDEKSTKPASTPTIFSAIDFNSGAVISVVREEACSVSDYAKSSFEKSPKKSNPRKCDFVLKPAEGVSPFQNIFSLDTYEKDASKLLISHDDRDNAVLRGVSRINDAKLLGTSGLRRSPPEYLSANDSARVDSYSSLLLDLTATTTIPTGGTYRDTMGLEQPNTIDRRVLAKAVATTTRITETADLTSQEPASETKLVATEERIAEKPSAEPNPDTSAVLTTKTRESTSNDATKESASNDAVPTPEPTENLVLKPDDLKEKYSMTKNREINSSIPEEVSAKQSGGSVTRDTEKENLPKLSPMNTGDDLSTTRADESPTSSRAAMMAMAATVDEPTTADSGQTPSAESIRNNLSAGDIEKAVKAATIRNNLSAGDIENAVEAAMEQAMKSAIEAVKENRIEPTIEAVMVTAKETAKEMALEMLTVNAEAETVVSDTSDASKSLPKGEAIQDKPPKQTMVIASTPDASAMASDTSLQTSDKELVASASPTASSDTSESVPIPAVTTTIATTVLSVWLSAPLDEWQKPVMGTRLNQIWESVQYTSDIILEGGEGLALLSQDDDDSMNAQLLLMNNKAMIR